MNVTEELRKLRQRAGLSMAELAKLVGYRTASGYQRYENSEEFTKEYLPVTLASKLTNALIGRGDPPIQRLEVFKLAGIVPETEEELNFDFLPARKRSRSSRIPIVQSDQLDLETLERTRNDLGLDSMPQHTSAEGVFGKEAFCVEITDNSMSSTDKNEISIEEGDRVICVIGTTIKPGDFVIAKRNIDDIFLLRKYRLIGHDSAGVAIVDLIPLNPDYPTVSLRPETPGHILARAQELRKTL